MDNIAGKKYKILERKSSQFGHVGIVDINTELDKISLISPKYDLAYYNNLKRDDIYTTALDKYVHDQLARPIINLIVNAIFNEAPDFSGDKELVAFANKVIGDSEIDWNKLGTDLEVYGDIFLRKFTGTNPKFASIPPDTIEIDYDEDNIIDIKRYVQFWQKPKERNIPVEDMVHIKINCPSNTVYGNSTLRPIFWWLDVLDNLWERNWIRGAQYYGSPVTVITGVPGEYHANITTSLQEKGQRPGRNWIFGEGVKVDTLDFTKNYPIELLIDRVYQYILAACNIPQHLVYESDSSRGVAMFSADGFEMMIKARRRTWEIGLIKLIRLMAQEDNLWNDNSKLSINWHPVFVRDLKNLASMIDIGLTQKILSKRTARELIGVDHSEELTRLEVEPEEEPEVVRQPPVVSNPMDNKPAPKSNQPNTTTS